MYNQEMNKGPLIGVVILAIIALGAVGFFVTNGGPAGSIQQNGDTKITDSADNMNGTSQSLRDLMAMSGSQHCTYSDPTTNSSGEVYVADGRVRGDFTTSIEDKTISAHTISDTSAVYVWTDDSNTGFKTDLTSLEDMSEGQLPSADTSNAVDINKQLNFSCRAWSTDNSKFSLPEGINFDSYDDVMKSVFDESDPESKSVQCATCDSLPDDAQNQCRELLGC